MKKSMMGFLIAIVATGTFALPSESHANPLTKAGRLARIACTRMSTAAYCVNEAQCLTHYRKHATDCAAELANFRRERDATQDKVFPPVRLPALEERITHWGTQLNSRTATLPLMDTTVDGDTAAPLCVTTARASLNTCIGSLNQLKLGLPDQEAESLLPGIRLPALAPPLRGN